MSINFECMFMSITSKGAVPDGKTLCTDAIHAAIDACEANGGGTVFVPAGSYLTGPIVLKSNICLYLDAGARLIFNDDPDLHPIIETRWEGAECQAYMPMLYGKGVSNVSIEGHGVLDGQGMAWWKAFRDKTLEFPRPRLISFEESVGISIKNITCLNSPAWTINPIRCSNITIDAVTIRNPPDSPNTDGINPDSCRDVRVANCHVDVGDDCITIKSGTQKSAYRVPCENIAISNCTLLHGHGGVVIGSEMSGDVRNVVISNCIFQGTDRGIRIKTRRGRGGVVEDILVTDSIMQDVLCPFVMHMYYHCGEGGKEPWISDKKPHPVTDATPAIRNIHISNVIAKNVRAAAIFLYGLPESPLSNISFQDISITMEKSVIPGVPAMMEGLLPIAKSGVFCCNADGISFNRLRLSGHEEPAFDIRQSNEVELSSCVLHNIRQNPIRLEECSQVQLRGNRLPQATRSCLDLVDMDEQAVRIYD